MNKELQDKAWSVLPKEFKEEVKELYHEYTFTREGYYTELFGLHNLTSDAEGEEMLTVSSNSVRVYKENIDRYRPKAVSAYDKGFWIGQDAALQDLFGSKCLRNEPASEPASEPKSETDKCFDSILKDSFRNERRLNVAVQMIKAMMGCPEIIERISSAATDSLLDDILSDALHLTDRLMSECEKGGLDGN